MEPNEEEKPVETLEKPAEKPAEPQAPLTPPTPSTSTLQAELDALQRRALAELSEQNSRLQAQLAERNRTPSTTPEEDAKTLFADPRRLIREEMQQIVAPLIDFRNEYTKERAYENLKSQLAQNPSLFKIYSAVASHVDSAMRTVEPTMQNLQTVIFSIYGAYTAGLLPGVPAPNTPKPETPVTPPYIPPSSPPAPKPPASGGPTTRELTEAEREIIKRTGQSKEQYLAYLHASEDVSTWKDIK